MYLLALGLFKRFASDQDGTLETTRAQGPVQSARSCDVGDGRKRYTRKRRATPDRDGKKVPTRPSSDADSTWRGGAPPL